MPDVNGVPDEVRGQIEILKKLDGALRRFTGKKISFNTYKDEDLKKVKVLRKRVGELRDEIQEVVQSLDSAKYSVTSSNSRFASSQRVVDQFLGE
jgi:hypothetical protein